MIKRKNKENTGKFIRKFRRGMLVIIMAGIFLTACGKKDREEEEQERQIEAQSELQNEAQTETEPAEAAEPDIVNETEAIEEAAEVAEEEAKVALADALAEKRTDENAWAFDYLALLDELEQDEYFSSDGIEYKLVYLDGDIPALAAGRTGYAVSVFAWHDGEITTLMDKEGYGLSARYWGCQPYQNKIYHHEFDNSCGIEYWTFYQISESYELEFLYRLSYTQDRENNLVSYGYQEDDRLWIEDPVEITEEEFLSYPLEGAKSGYNVPDYVEIVGDSDIEDMRWQLGRAIDPDKEEAVFLRKVTQSYDMEKNVWVLYFLFSNDTLVDVERKGSLWMKNVIYRDITGDGIDEVLVYQEKLVSEPDVYSQSYLYIEFFQIEEDVVTEISPRTQLEELGDDVWNMEIIEDLSKEYGGIVLKMENNEKKTGEKSVDKSMLVGYRDGVWEIIQ